MLRNMFVLFTIIDVLAINAALDQSNPQLAQLGFMWLVLYSAVPAWAIGMRAWKECQGNCGGPQTLLRMLACSSIVYAACAATVDFAGKNPEEWLSIFLFIVVYLLRLTPAAAATVLMSPFLWISQPKLKTLVLVLICQVCCWYGGRTLLGQEADWHLIFLYYGLWAPNWGFALMIGGVMLKPLLKGEAPASNS